MRKLSSPSFLAAALLPFTLAACTESFTASGGSGGGGTTTSAGGTTTTATTTSMGGDTGTGGSTGGATGGTSTGGATGGTTSTTGGTGGAPECMTKADCGAHQTCTNGQCVCENGYTDCGGACVNTMTDPMHCGACGTTCGYSCVTGTCNDPVDVAAGVGTTCAVLALGDLYCWGRNDAGEFGSGSGAGAAGPVKVLGGLPPVKRVFIGKAGDVAHVCAFTEAGNLYCWGHNAGGKIGVGNMDMLAILSVSKVTGSPLTTDVGLGGFFSVSINNGGLLGWGTNDVAQQGYVGIGSLVPNASSGFQGSAVAAGGAHTCIISSDKLQCFGRNQEGQIGNGSTGFNATPTEVNLEGDVAKGVAAGNNFTCVRTDKNTARCWGQNNQGQIGVGNNNSPQPSPGNAVNTQGAAVSAVFAGAEHAGAIAGENLYLWGNNGSGQVAPIGASSQIFTPMKVPGLHVVRRAALGGQHTCVLDKQGTAVSLLCWGGNSDGQLGQNSVGGDHVAAAKVAFPAP